MRIAEAEILIVPGLGNSGDNHWQRRWGDRFRTARFVEQQEWGNPQRQPWVETIDTAVRMATRPVVLIAHSLGVSAVVHAAERMRDADVRGAFLVSAPDLELNANVPPETAPFSPVPRDPLPFPSMLVVSTSDPFCSLDRAVDFATCWGSDFHVAGDAGHINAASGHGPWPEGLLMFTRLMQRLRA
jgi:predicted alpha/beta hydrolase family esterase